MTSIHKCNFVARALVGPTLAAAARLAPHAAHAHAIGHEGAWKLTSIIRTGSQPVNLTKPAPGYTLYSHGHYATITDNSATARPAAPAPKDPANPTDADRLAKFVEWGPLQAQAGTYELKGATLTRTPEIAKNVGQIGQPNVQQITIKGDTLTMVSQAPAGQTGTQTVTMTRVK
jgi:hypothetical protein